MIGQYVSLALLILVSGLHIYSLVKRNYLLKSITKIFILPLIISFYLFAVTNVKAPINWLLVSGLICGWFGDIILIPKKKIAVVIGGWLFLSEQVLLTISIIYKTNMANISLAWFIVLPILFFIFSFSYGYIFVKKYVKLPLFIFGTGYLGFNGLTTSMSLCLLISNPCWQTGLLFLGALLFYISDSILVYVRMADKPKIDQRHIFIMTTYIIAQFLIMIGFI